MSYNYVLSDSLIRLKNAQMAGLLTTDVVYSKLMISVFDLLKKEGFISDFVIKEVRKGVNFIEVFLKYSSSHKGVIEEIKIFSKPGRRVYFKHSDKLKYFDGLGLLVLSTSKGIVTDMDATDMLIGGELLFGIY
ncbi:30S ribosomal protein S8 [Anaplasmataceae bacterium AB001_6]|nr:30S ribosomal protein S8 [Anaplasmataceae bacterium AB001_6]